MLKDTLSQTDLLELPMFAFLLFLATFTFVTARVLLRSRNDPKTRALAELPLSADCERAETDHER